MCTLDDNATVPPASYGHCLHCYNDAVADKPVLWNAYVRVSRREARNERGMVLGIYGGLGHHRYPAVGSGDTFEEWYTLSFEIWLTMTAANVATEWSHDLGGCGMRLLRLQLQPPATRMCWCTCAYALRRAFVCACVCTVRVHVCIRHRACRRESGLLTPRRRHRRFMPGTPSTINPDGTWSHNPELCVCCCCCCCCCFS
jgi:hypothetical protein